MSQMEQEGTGAVNPPLPVEDPAAVDPMQVQDDGQDLARFTLSVPLRDLSGREIPHVLAAVRQALSDAGFDGRNVIPLVQGDWKSGTQGYETEDVSMVMIDAENTPENLKAIKMAAQGIKETAGADKVYLTVQPLRTYLI
jgi:hypothetical protein